MTNPSPTHAARIAPPEAKPEAAPAASAQDTVAAWNLTKFLALTGIASRRRCAELIKAALVTVNGTRETNPARTVTDADEVCCDGKRLRRREGKVYILLHKPRGYVCTNDDFHAKKKAIDLITPPPPERLFYAGRLDKDSEGLILYSNDGDFVARLTHPRHQTVKTYLVSLDAPLSDADIRRMLTGIESDGELLRARAVRRLRLPNQYHFFLTEGKNREIRRMLEAVANRARRLIRVAVGTLELGALPSGQWRYLTADEVRKAFDPPAFLRRGNALPGSPTPERTAD